MNNFALFSCMLPRFLTYNNMESLQHGRMWKTILTVLCVSGRADAPSLTSLVKVLGVEPSVDHEG